MKNPNLADSLEGFIHHAVQYLSMIGHSYLPHKKDDSHTNFLWDPKQKAFLGHLIEGPTAFRAAFFPEDFSLRLVDKHAQSKVEIKINCQSPDTVSGILQQALGGLGYEGKKLQPISHFEIPEEPLKSEKVFRMGTPTETRLWILMRSTAQEMIENIVRELGLDLEVRTWPHHFDAGIYSPLKVEGVEDAGGIGIGWAISDSVAGQPYYYVTGYRQNGAIDFDELKDLSVGNWSRKNWKGAFLRAEEAFSDVGQAKDDKILSFLRESSSAILKALEV